MHTQTYVYIHIYDFHFIDRKAKRIVYKTILIHIEDEVY